MPTTSESVDQVFAFVRQIPAGKVLNYKRVGIPFGLTGRQVGKVMSYADKTVPWWRVVDASGGYPVSKRDPKYENEQRDKLTSESVPLKKNGKVDLNLALWQDDVE
jgi:alkylated DNA nucleotide flippase Atl1